MWNRLYVESAFPLRSEALTVERDELLARRGTSTDPGTLAQPPVLETVPVYNRTTLTLQQLSQQLVSRHGLDPAYADLLRLFIDWLRLTIDSQQLVFLSTTASLDQNDPRSCDFLRQFFGRDRFEIVSRPQTPPPTNARRRVLPFAQAFAAFAQAVHPQPQLPVTATNLPVASG